jgi:RNase H-fold protein (predicted Holliday junction resolvase)
MNRLQKRFFIPATMNTKFILAIAPGKREFGVAVFSAFEPVYVSVKTIRNQKSKENSLEKMSSILRKLFEEFSIGLVVTKSISQYQKLSPDLERIVEHIRFEAIRNGLQVVEITVEQIKSELCKNENPTEKRAFEMLLASYPELERYWNRPNKWQNDYYAFLFSAVAVGAVYLNTLSQKN